MVKGRIALERLPTVGTCFPLERLVELHHASSYARLTTAALDAPDADDLCTSSGGGSAWPVRCPCSSKV